MIVDPNISGSFVVVVLDADTCIDARKDVRQPDTSFIEVVQNGQVIHRAVRGNEHAPDYIIRVMRDYAKGTFTAERKNHEL